MGKGLGSQFVNSWIRQMGRESAHTAYGNMTGKNRMEDIRQIKEEKTFPAAKDYFRLVILIAGHMLLQFLLVFCQEKGMSKSGLMIKNIVSV